MPLNPLESSFDAIPIARLYGVSESVKNILSKNSKNNLCLLCNRSDKTTSIQRRSRANLSKSEFLLFFKLKVLHRLAKATRPAFAELNSGVKVGNTKHSNGTKEG
jgi:hypothetical protein